MKKVYYTLLLGAILLSSCSKLSDDLIQFMPFDIIAEGSYSNLTDADSWVIKNENAWTEFKDQGYIQEEILTPIDFDSHTLIAVSQGEKPTGGYGIHVAEIEEFENELVVHVISSAPDENDTVTLAFTQPYQVVRIGKTSKTISFN